MGLETNEAYIKKSKKALETLYQLKKSKAIRSNSTKLLKAHRILNALGLATIFGKLIKSKASKIEQNLTAHLTTYFLNDFFN